MKVGKRKNDDRQVEEREKEEITLNKNCVLTLSISSLISFSICTVLLSDSSFNALNLESWLAWSLARYKHNIIRRDDKTVKKSTDFSVIPCPYSSSTRQLRLLSLASSRSLVGVRPASRCFLDGAEYPSIIR
jgi:hypothetical protein